MKVAETTNRNYKVIISILNWNNWKNTVETVSSLLKSDYKNYKIIILDNASIDNSCLEIRKQFPQIELWGFKNNIGYAGAHKKLRFMPKNITTIYYGF